MAMDSALQELLGGPVDVLPAGGAAESVPVQLAAGTGTGGVAHDGSKTLSDLAMWRPSLRSADADLLPEKATIDARARDMVRNDALVASGATIWKDSIVGARYMLNARPATKVLFGKDDDTWEEEFQEEVETKFALWAESPKHWADSRGIGTLTDIVRLAVGVYVAGGEVTGIADWLPGAGRPYRTAFQMIDSDRLCNPTDYHLGTYPYMRNGVEVDGKGRPVAYWFRNSHPSEGPFHDYSDLSRQKWTRVPANRPWGRDNVLHVYEQMRPEQSRGVSVLTSALTEMRYTKNFRKTQLQKAVIAATYAAAFEAELPDDVVSAVGAGTAADGNPTTQWMLDYLASVQEYSGGSKNLHIDGAAIPILPPGMKLNLQNPGAQGPEDEAFMANLLRYIASALNLSYEQFSRDYTKTNYSSARASIGEAWKAMQSQKRMVADRVASFIYRLWLEEAINRNDLETLKRANVPNFYEGLNAEAYSQADWIGAGRGMIDPLKETQADKLALAAGLTTKEAVIARRDGGDWRRTAKQIKRELENDRKLEIPSVYEADTQDQDNALSGTPQERES